MAEFNVNALQAMIHHVTRKYAMHPHKLGSVKLYKVLWWAEVRSLRLRGEQIAGEVFHKEEFGPFSIQLNEVVRELVSAGKLTFHKAEQGFENLHPNNGDGSIAILHAGCSSIT